MSLFQWRKKKPSTDDIELAPVAEHFSVAGHNEPTTTFEIVDAEDPAPTPDPHARYKPATSERIHAPEPDAATYRTRPRDPNFRITGPMPAPAYVTPRPVRAPRLEPPPVEIEWARRGVGPAPTGKVRGMCSGCSSVLFVSRAPRPLRVNSPVCGRSKVLT